MPFQSLCSSPASQEVAVSGLRSGLAVYVIVPDFHVRYSSYTLGERKERPDEARSVVFSSGLYTREAFGLNAESDRAPYAFG